MAIASMKRLLLVGLESERRELLKKLQKTRQVQVFKAQELELGSDSAENGAVLSKTVDTADQISDLQLKLARLKFAFAFLKSQKLIVKKADKKNKKTPEKGQKAEDGAEKRPSGLLSSLVPTPEITFDEFVALYEREDEIFAQIEKLEKFNETLINIKTEQVKSKTLIEQVKPYLSVSDKFSTFKDTEKVSVLFGLLPSVKQAEFAEIVASDERNYYEIFEGGTLQPAVIICLKECKDVLLEKLSAVEFALNSFAYDKNAKEIVYEESAKLLEFDKRKLNVAREAILLDKEISGFKLMFDFYSVEMQKLEAEGNMLQTQKTFVMEAWLPEFAHEKVDGLLSSSDFCLAYEITSPLPTDLPPTLCNNNRFVAPYETVTDMYSSPVYGEVDPNKFVAVFFILFFGMMVSDAGYGILLTLSTAFIWFRKKFKKHEGRIIKVLFAGGLSTVFWGVMFGSYFGMEWIKPVLFSPLVNPLAMMGLALGLGLIQMVFGMGVNAYILFKQKKPLEAVLSVFSWYAVFLGLGFVVMAMLTKISALTTVGLVFAVLGLVGVLAYGAMGKKGFKKVTGAFGNVYQAINIMSDLLSYTRLFGLGLATGVIGMVFNQIAGVIKDMIPGVGIILAIFIGIVGHAFNIGINTLGAYVHNARLQYVEFFGKFYTGGGKLFNPLGANMKYYNLQD